MTANINKNLIFLSFIHQIANALQLSAEMAAPAISNANAIARAVPRTIAARNKFDGVANFKNKCQLVMEN